MSYRACDTPPHGRLVAAAPLLFICLALAMPASGSQGAVSPPPPPPAQAAAAGPPPAAGLQPTAAPPEARAQQAEVYAYRPAGRRDPFVSLLRRGVDRSAPGKRPEGIGGIGANELVLKGIVESKGAFVALVHGPDGRTHTVRVNDRLFDGTIKTITADTLVIAQEVNDPLSLSRQSEIRKSLRVVEEVK
jgi:Tfp pilus assembly protein PilP